MTGDGQVNGLLRGGGLATLFQPILEVGSSGRRLFALECLTRGPRGSGLESAEALFADARRKRLEGPLDRAAVAAALRAARDLPGEPRLSLNVHASSLARDVDFARFLVDTAGACSVSPDRLVVEVLDQVFPWDERSLVLGLERLRAAGVSIALDDVGHGYSNYRMIVDCRPDYLKVDGRIVQGCGTDSLRQAILQATLAIGRRLGARVVAKAIESAADLAVACSLGVDLVQGFLLGRPAPADELGSLVPRDRPTNRTVATFGGDDLAW